MPLRWKLLGALPVINLVTGVVVSGLSSDGSASLELTVLVAVPSCVRSRIYSGRGLGQARRSRCACARRSWGEVGQLAGGFNEMMEAVSNARPCGTACGSSVDPDVTERVLEEGELLEGQERDVTAMFVDVRDFTPICAAREPDRDGRVRERAST